MQIQMFSPLIFRFCFSSTLMSWRLSNTFCRVKTCKTFPVAKCRHMRAEVKKKKDCRCAMPKKPERAWRRTSDWLSFSFEGCHWSIRWHRIGDYSEVLKSFPWAASTLRGSARRLWLSCWNRADDLRCYQYFTFKYIAHSFNALCFMAGGFEALYFC